MKKYVLSLVFCLLTTSLLAVESNHSYFKSSNFVNDYSIEMKGFGDFNVFYNQSNANNMKQSNRIDREILGVLSVIISSNYDESFRYGVRFADVVDNQFGNTLGAEIFLGGTMGRLEFGGLKDVTENMRVGADTLAIATGGINGAAPRYIKDIGLIDFLVAPGTLMNQNFGYYSEEWGGKFSNKINYTTSEFYGFKVGLSIKPNAKINRGTIKGLGDNGLDKGVKVDLGTFVSGAVSYVNTFGDFGIALALTYEENFANPVNVTNGTREISGGKFKSGEVSLSMTYFGLSLAGSFGKDYRDITNKDLMALNKNNGITDKLEGSYFTYGASYEMGPISISATFFDSKNDNNHRNIHSNAYAFKYNLSRNLSWYCEYIDFKFSGSEISGKSGKAFGVFTGVTLQF